MSMHCISRFAIEQINVPSNSNTEGNADTEETHQPQTFKYENKTFRLIININIKQLFIDIKKTAPVFQLHVIDGGLHCDDGQEDEQISYLALFICFNLNNSYYRKIMQPSEIKSLLNIISIHFYGFDTKLIDEHHVRQQNHVNQQHLVCNYSLLNDLYGRLRGYHQLSNETYSNNNTTNNNSNSNVPEDVQHKSLMVKLRQYQVDAVKWMLFRELNTEYLDAKLIEIYGINDVDKKQAYYFNLNTMEITLEKPVNIKIPSGGILADEMGLGKTIEILTLILMNPKRNKRKFSEISKIELIQPEPPQTTETTKIHQNHPIVDNSSSSSSSSIFCICTIKRKEMIDLIKCNICEKYQHKYCVSFESSVRNDIKNYVCPQCWQFESCIETGCTLIVVPATIKQQWFTEIRRHIDDTSVNVLSYDGIRKDGKWQSPWNISKFTIIITDYNVLSSEIRYLNHYNISNTPRTLRRVPTYMIPTSPLVCIKWWRICLDEAQLIENTKKTCLEMIQAFPSVHRWSITGTPIGNSINDLYALIRFINLEPYTIMSAWKELTKNFNSGNDKALLDVLKKIMWRTSKADILNQICDIPEQTEIIHYVTMSTLEAYFYNIEHEKCATRFKKHASRIQNQETLSMRAMDATTFKLVMEPLLKLRQDCTVQSVYMRDKTDFNKRFLTPMELSNHLIATNDNECKSSLRTIVSSLNGLAALSISKKEYNEAINCYDKVLRWSKDYTGNICVDSLLQIHALYNVIICLNEIKSDDVTKMNECQNELNRLEWRYIEVQSQMVQCKITQTEDLRNKIKDIEQNCYEHKWVSVVIDAFDSKRKKLLIDKWYEVQQSKTKINECHSDSLIALAEYAQTWIDSVLDKRFQLLTVFEKMYFFMHNIKPTYLMPESILYQIKIFLMDAKQCHINEVKDSNNKKHKCSLCIIEKAILSYESTLCRLVTRTGADAQEGTGHASWNAPAQEILINYIITLTKKDDKIESDIKEGELFVERLRLFKSEFKEITKLWVELKNATLLFDELEMCKSRLNFYEGHQLRNDYLMLLSDELMHTYDDFTYQLHQAEISFKRKYGTKRFLEHVSQKDEIDNCPICTMEPAEQYVMLECGHHLCLDCFSRIKEFSRVNFVCSLCRSNHYINDVFFVACDKKALMSDGEYSKKVTEINKVIIDLLTKDSMVKILLFSQWDKILKVIADSLAHYNISYILKSSNMQKDVHEFKTQPFTCFLLPLGAGSKGLNLIEATHVFLIEPILNPGDELQAISRVHRIGQTKKTFVHRFIVQNSIEEKIYATVSNDKTDKWKSRDVTLNQLLDLFTLNG